MKIIKSLAIYYLLTILLLALVPILSALFGISMDFESIAVKASEQSGILWTSNLINVIRLSLIEPGLWLLILGSFVPTLAALVVLLWTRDRTGLRTLLRRFNPLGISHVSIKRAISNYALLIGGILFCLTLTFWIRNTIGASYQRENLSLGAGLLLTILFSGLFDQGAVLEEPGWRGYATPLFQGGGVNPLVAAIVIGIAWSFWHIPRDVVTGLIAGLGPLNYLFLYLPAFTLGTVTVSIIAALFMNRIGGSLIPAILVHGLANDAIGIAGQATIQQALTPGHQITKALPFLAFAILLVIWQGSTLAYDGSVKVKSK
ncbi:CPBP family intramembrane metalloprotease [Chloroflexi bacterium TSY]|nr:CPBP family intramembrane metalloprotease [Chloroflexi bacterium TSY]